MKLQIQLVLVLSSAFLFSCSSAPKKAESSPSAAVTAPAPAPAKPVEAAKPDDGRLELVCEHGSDKRLIVLVPGAKEPQCEVHYSKFGESERVASALHTAGFCAEVHSRIRSNLEAGQFKCSDPDSAPRKTASAPAAKK